MIEVTRTKSEITFKSPFHPELPRLARKIGGDWDGSVWRFNIGSEAAALGLYKSVYGYDENSDVSSKLVIRVGNHPVEAIKGGIYLAGRFVAKSKKDCSGISLGDGVKVLKGEIEASETDEGIRTRIPIDTVIELSDVYVHAAKNYMNMYGYVEGIQVEVTDFSMEGDQKKLQRSPANKSLVLVELAYLRTRLSAISKETNDLVEAIIEIESRME